MATAADFVDYYDLSRGASWVPALVQTSRTSSIPDGFINVDLVLSQLLGGRCDKKPSLLVN